MEFEREMTHAHRERLLRQADEHRLAAQARPPRAAKRAVRTGAWVTAWTARDRRRSRAMWSWIRVLARSAGRA
jgi:hypothetical protein